MMRILVCLVPVFSFVGLLNGEIGTLPDVRASLTLEKQQYLIGEPIMLIFHASDTGPTPIGLPSSNPYSGCSEYKILIDPKEPNDEPPPGPPCAPLFQGIIGECLAGAINLEPGQRSEQRVLLNRFHRFNQAGMYTINSTRHLSYFKNWGKPNQPIGQVSGTFTIEIVAPRSPDDLEATFSPYLADLRAGSFERRYEATTAIATLAAPFLETSLLQMLSMPALQAEGVRGLKNLNTEKARAALFDFVQPDGALTPEQELALEALMEMKDGSYGLPLLGLWNASKHKERKVKLLLAAARLRPAVAKPVIQSLLQSSQARDRQEGVKALEATEQPEVLPRLVQRLTDSSVEVREAAAHALVSLTRRSPSEIGMDWSGADPATDADYWSSWLRTKPSSPINPIRKCPQMTRP